MNKTIRDNSVILETLISIFTVEKGKLKILLEKKQDDPYKGYWKLPGDILDKEETLEKNINDVLQNIIGTSKIYKEQNHTFSELNRTSNERTIATSYIAIIDNNIIKETDIESKWFIIDEIPKMAYDHKKIIDAAKELLKNRLINTTILKNLFPSDFTLPELQNIFESIMNIKLDRRNFRKKFINLGLIEETGYNTIGGSGRPAKLYKFKDDIKEINLF